MSDRYRLSRSASGVFLLEDTHSGKRGTFTTATDLWSELRRHVRYLQAKWERDDEVSKQVL